MKLKSLAYLSTCTIATTLYATHYDGHIFTLSLSVPENHSNSTPTTNASLTLVNTLKACGSMPSWLTLDSEDHTLYCVDESGGPSSGNGSLSSFAISSNGSLFESESSSVRVPTIAGGVASVIYQLGEKKYLAVAHYSDAALSTFQLPLTATSKAEQVFTFNLKPSSSSLNTPHPHQPILDPTGQYLLVFDLGADLIRIFSIDAYDGTLTECDPFPVTQGNGPRHGAFRSAPRPSSSSSSSSSSPLSPSPAANSRDNTTLYVVNELANTLSVYAVDYAGESSISNGSSGHSGAGGACGAFSLSTTDQIIPYPTTPAPDKSYVSEIQIRDEHIYISIRNDQGFAPDDSMVTLQTEGSGDDDDNGNDNAVSDKKVGRRLVVKDLSSSYGAYPRTFAISSDGSMVAIGDQVSSNVAVVARDPSTGELGGLLASLQLGSRGQVGQSTGLSSVVWGDVID